ncbi:MAG: TOBE domain-containing protein [Burkholderiaceae bacterium]|nr:TOBE domain-containing protein [Burkholderiaceae bacterium]
MTKRPIQHKLVGKLSVDTQFGAFLGDTRIRLLEAIDRYGSITQAAKAVPLSYKAAWDAVDAMNNVAEETLVERSTGGLHGGGTRLTAYGRRLIAMYRALEQESQLVLERLAARLGDVDAADIHQFQSLLHRMSMRCSARNQFVGPVTALREGAVNYEVSLRLDAEHELSAIITKESATNLGLAIGRETHAFVKASAVILMTDQQIRISARNQLWGEISRIDEGAVNNEVTITLAGGRTVTSIVTQESAHQLELAVGKRVCALFKASSVILATFE